MFIVGMKLSGSTCFEWQDRSLSLQGHSESA